jgi:hypothetical protein
MSRALRRQLERDQRRGINRQDRVVSLPSLLDEFTVFDIPQRIFDQISSGQVDAVNGIPVFRDNTGELCEVVPALQGWIDTWKDISEKLNLSLDLDQMQVICSRLHYSMPITEEQISAARVALRECRIAFRTTDRKQITAIAKTSQIKMLMEVA